MCEDCLDTRLWGYSNGLMNSEILCATVASWIISFMHDSKLYTVYIYSILTYTVTFTTFISNCGIWLSICQLGYCGCLVASFSAVVDQFSVFGTHLALRFVNHFLEFDPRADWLKQSFRISSFNRIFVCEFPKNLVKSWAFFVNNEPSESTGFCLSHKNYLLEWIS